MTLEYKTKFYPLTLYRMSALDHEEQGGFRRVWADVTDEGTFVVYRRSVDEKKAKKRVWVAGK